MRSLVLAAWVFLLLGSRSCLGQEPDLDEFAQLLQARDLTRRHSVLAGLAEIAASGSDSKRAISLIVDALAFPDAEVREEALGVIRELGPRAASATPALIRLLDARAEEEQRRAAGAIAAIGTGANAAGEALLEVVCDQQREHYTRQAAVVGLGELERSPELDHALLRVYADRSQGMFTRPLALQVFGRGRGADPAKVIPILTRALKDSSDLVREEAVVGLDHHGPAGTEAAPALVAALSDRVPRVAGYAADSLERIGEPALPALIEPVLYSSEREGALALSVMEDIAKDLAQKGTLRWWVIPRVFLRELTFMSLWLLTWIAAARIFPRRAPAVRALRAIQISIVVGVPTVAVGLSVHGATTFTWASYFLPEPPSALVSPATAATLSCMFLVALPAAWACIRQSEGPGLEGTEP